MHQVPSDPNRVPQAGTKRFTTFVRTDTADMVRELATLTGIPVWRITETALRVWLETAARVVRDPKLADQVRERVRAETAPDAPPVRATKKKPTPTTRPKRRATG